MSFVKEDEMLNIMVGKRVRQLRLQRKLTQEQLAERAGISASFLAVELGSDDLSVEKFHGVGVAGLRDAVRRRAVPDEILKDRVDRGSAQRADVVELHAVPKQRVCEDRAASADLSLKGDDLDVCAQTRRGADSLAVGTDGLDAAEVLRVVALVRDLHNLVHEAVKADEPAHAGEVGAPELCGGVHHSLIHEKPPAVPGFMQVRASIRAASVRRAAVGSDPAASPDPP